VYRNDALSVADVLALKPRAAVLSPAVHAVAGRDPRAPWSRRSRRRPRARVCLGHQAIGEAFGGRVVAGVSGSCRQDLSRGHDGDELFPGNPSPVTGMRYIARRGPGVVAAGLGRHRLER